MKEVLLFLYKDDEIEHELMWFMEFYTARTKQRDTNPIF